MFFIKDETLKKDTTITMNEVVIKSKFFRDICNNVIVPRFFRQAGKSCWQALHLNAHKRNLRPPNRTCIQTVAFYIFRRISEFFVRRRGLHCLQVMTCCTQSLQCFLRSSVSGCLHPHLMEEMNTHGVCFTLETCA